MDLYKIVHSDPMPQNNDAKISNLENKIKILLSKGWICVGAPVISFTDCGQHIVMLYQAMIKRE